MGRSALAGETTGISNTATGEEALSHNTTGNDNTATGVAALTRNTTGGDNTAIGFDTLGFNTTGIDNTATGRDALLSNTTGNDNTANGFHALSSNTTGANNIALGSNAGSNLTTGNNNIDIGAPGVNGEANKIRIGQSGTQNGAFIAGISGVTVANGVGVIVNSSGKLGTVVSSARFKEAIKPMDEASEAILALRPVSFRYKHDIDPEGIPQFGLVAEQVEKVNPDLVVRGEDGKVMTVRYDAVNAMLLNEFLKEHRKVEEQQQMLQTQQATIVRQQKEFESKFAEQQKQIEALTATVQKVSAQIQMNKPAPRVAADTH
jgi:polyhydroxyalkanoate synthesis regulator phasin